MNILNGIMNFLQFIDENWTAIVVVIGLALAVGKKIYNFFKKSNEEKIIIAKRHIQEVALKLVTDAEENYYEWQKAGAIKRAQVIEEIFAMYPVLSKVVNQEELIEWIDETIDASLKTMREVIESNAELKEENIASE